jgi:hypothetical protein
MNGKVAARFRLASVFCMFLLAPVAHAAGLKPEAIDGWNRYVAVAEARMDREQRDPSRFLWIDRLSGTQRESAEQQVKKNQVVIERIQVDSNATPIKTPGALIHHWIGTAFVSGATMQQALTLVQNYDNHFRVYKPEIESSKLISRDGDHFIIFLRYRERKIITVVLNTVHDVRYYTMDAKHVYCRTFAIKVREVADPGTAKERERAVDDQNGFLWKMNTYWNFEERDGGVYLQCEAITLTRSVPVALRWLIESYITSIPHESLTGTMNATRQALAAPAHQ